MQDAKVIPLLFGLELSDLSGPLSQFQALKVDEQGMLNALKAINDVSDAKTDEATIEMLVPALWSQLQEKLDEIPDKEVLEKHMRPQTEILEDLVSQVRGLGSRMRDFDPDMMERNIAHRKNKHREFDPRMLEDMMHSMAESHGADFSLVMLAGFVREQMPWLAEALVEAHRELKTASAVEARQIGHQLHEIVMLSTRSKWADRMMMRSKRFHMLMMEMPMYVDRAISQRLETRQIPEGVGEDDENEPEQ